MEDLGNLVDRESISRNIGGNRIYSPPLIVMPNDGALGQTRRQFLKTSAAGLAAALAAGPLVAGNALANTPDEVVVGITEYVHAMSLNDLRKAGKVYKRLKPQIEPGAKVENDPFIVTILPTDWKGFNKHLIPRDFFLFEYTFTGPIKIHPIVRREIFDSFTDEDGQKRTDIFGLEFNPVKTYTLGPAIYSTDGNLKNYALMNGKHQLVDGLGHVIALTHPGHKDEALNERLLEEGKVHETTHILLGPYESTAYAAEFGYIRGREIVKKIKSPEDIVAYLLSKNQTRTPFVFRQLYELHDPQTKSRSHDESLKFLGRQLTKITSEVHGLDPRFPKDPFKISDQQFWATMEMVFNNHEASQRYRLNAYKP